MRLAGWTFAGAGRFALAERLGARLGGDLPIHKLPPPLSAWTRTRDLKRPARQTFRSWWKHR